MSLATAPNRRHFTEAARAAAKLKREQLALVPRDKAAPAVFVVRPPAPLNLFRWEVRRLGSIVLCRSAEDFTTLDDARAAGERALAGMLPT